MGCYDEPYDAFDQDKVKLMLHKRDINGLINIFREKNDRNFDLRTGVSEALASIGGDEVVDALITALGDDNYYLRKGAADTLGRIGGKRAVDGLMSGMRDPKARDQARWALVSIGGPYVIERLVTDLKDKDPLIRASSAYTLGKLKDAGAVEPLIEALKDPDAEVRENAVEALGELRDPRAVEPLTPEDMQSSVSSLCN
jgi:HEAT repeat protein